MKVEKQTILNMQLSEEEVAHCVEIVSILCNNASKQGKDGGTDMYISAYYSDLFNSLVNKFNYDGFGEIIKENYSDLRIKIQDK